LVESGRGLILGCYPGIRLEELRKTTITSIRIAGLWDRESNPRPPEYEVGVLITRPRRSVYTVSCNVYFSSHNILKRPVKLSSSLFQGNKPLLACSDLMHLGASSVVCPDFLCLFVHIFLNKFGDLDLGFRFTCCIHSVTFSSFNVSSSVL
jgi:hypothetical protein